MIKNYTQIHGHRGFRGFYPENTLIGFTEAVKLGVDAIELDVVITKDKKVLVSHEPIMLHQKCLNALGNRYNALEEKNYGTYQLNYNKIKKFDCGSIGHDQYPQQAKIKCYKPLLSEVFETIENYLMRSNSPPLIYNIEIKSEQDLIGISQPSYHEFIDLLIEEITRFNLQKRCVIQSFDKQLLQTLHTYQLNMPISMLVEDAKPAAEHLAMLGFIPSIFAIEFPFLNADLILLAQQNNMSIYAFTVNDKKDILSCLNYGIDAIITDYPNVAIALRDNHKAIL